MSVDLSTTDVAVPPASPWRELVPSVPAHSYVSYFYADDLAQSPVRAITRVKDNKSDPNLETGTYGLFSTCQQQMRSGIVKYRPRYVFFVTRPRGGPRVLVGMYELGWWAPGTFHRRTRDFAIAAKRVRFIDPIPLRDLPGALGPELSARWRVTKRLGPEPTSALLTVVEEADDRTDAYLAEVERMETINLFHSGYRYATWKRVDRWSWDDASRYLRPTAVEHDGAPVRNSSPSGWWRCLKCESSIENAALLKACPVCGELDTLRPLPMQPASSR